MTIIEFLLAEIAKDEAWAHENAPTNGHGSRLPERGEAWSTASLALSARVLAECEAKRRIIEFRVAEDYADDGMVTALRALASVYADRPGWREEWRP